MNCEYFSNTQGKLVCWANGITIDMNDNAFAHLRMNEICEECPLNKNNDWLDIDLDFQGRDF